MKEIYLITRLDAIHGFLTFIMVFFLFFIFLSSIIYICNRYSFYDKGKQDNEHKAWMSFTTKTFWVSFVILFISTTSWILLPTTKEAYIIYGVGGTIDYLSNDSIATEIPHNVLEALNGWVKEINHGGN